MNKIINYPNKNTKLIIKKDYSKYYLNNLDNSKKHLIITDNILYSYYEDLLDSKDSITFIMQSGDQNKSFENYLKIINILNENSFTRSDEIIAFGGGVVTDLSLFVAGSYQRGMDITLIPTSLLAMVDASIGGKCGINYNGYKNQIGMFYFPSQIIIDESLLNTLDKDEFYNGFSEIIKCALIKDKKMFEEIESNNFVLEDLINRAIAIKLSVIKQDIYDMSLRKLLNFGHTYGHIIESDSSFSLKHGHAVAIGMCKEAQNSLYYERIVNLLSKYFDLNYEIEQENIYKYLLKDKKASNSQIDVVELKDIGNALVVTKSIEEVINEYLWKKH